jgi:hypothetical protein
MRRCHTHHSGERARPRVPRVAPRGPHRALPAIEGYDLHPVNPPIMSDFLGSATVPVAPVGVPPTESFSRNRLTCWVIPEAHRQRWGGQLDGAKKMLTRDPPMRLQCTNDPARGANRENAKAANMKTEQQNSPNENVWAFGLGKGSIGGAGRQGTEFQHKESLLIPAAFAETKGAATRQRIWCMRPLFPRFSTPLACCWSAYFATI